MSHMCSLQKTSLCMQTVINSLPLLELHAPVQQCTEEDKQPDWAWPSHLRREVLRSQAVVNAVSELLHAGAFQSPSGALQGKAASLTNSTIGERNRGLSSGVAPRPGAPASPGAPTSGSSSVAWALEFLAAFLGDGRATAQPDTVMQVCTPLPAVCALYNSLTDRRSARLPWIARREAKHSSIRNTPVMQALER